MSPSLSSRHRAWGAAIAFSATLVLGAAAPIMAGATPAASTTTEAPTGASTAVSHNDTAPANHPACTSGAGTSGTCSTPQPLSTADLNNSGANTTSTSNPYVSTRNGAPSDNGSGTGNASGKPCAGCVGRADNKNPAGQAPSGPIDHNNGYECDGNNGIGQGNPAHTGCTAPLVTPVGTTTGSTGTTTGSTGTTTGSTNVPASAGSPQVTAPGNTQSPVSGSILNGTNPAPAANSPRGTGSSDATGTAPPAVLAVEGSRAALPAVNGTVNTTPATEVLALSATSPASLNQASGTLPFTGTNTQTLLEIAAGALIIGFGCLSASRRRAPAQI